MNYLRTIALGFVLSLFMVSCGKSHIEADFCQAAASQDYNELGKYIENYLDKQDQTLNSTAKHENLKTWLEDFSCVSTVDVFQEVIETNSAQSEIIVEFITDGGSQTMVVDLAVQPSKLEFLRFH